MAEKYVNATIKMKVNDEVVKIYPQTTADQIIVTTDLTNNNEVSKDE